MRFNFKTFKRSHLLIAGATTLAAGAALASTGTGTGATDFTSVASRLQNWMEGTLGKTFAIGSLGVGLAIGVVKQSVMSVVTGVAVALSASIGPGVLNGIFTAVM